MFKFLLPAIFFMGNALGEGHISNIKLTPTELEIVGDGLEGIKSVAITSNDSSKEFEIENVSTNQVIARPLDETTLGEGKVNLIIFDSGKEFIYPITIFQKNGLVTFYKKEIPVVSSPRKMVLDQIDFLPGVDFTGYDYNYSLYANPTGDFAIKGVNKDLFTIDNLGNVEISGTLKVKGRPVGYQSLVNKVCPKGQILKSDGINFICSLEASQENQLGPVYTKSNFGIDQIMRDLQISNVVIGADNNISGVVNFTSLGILDVATGTFHVEPATGRVGVGDTTPSVKLDITGALNSGIRLKQGGQLSNVVGSFSNGMVFENSSNTNAVAIGYGASDLFSIVSFNGSVYNTVFTLNGAGNGAILGNLKVGAYLLPAADGVSGAVLKTDGAGTVSWSAVAGGTVTGPATTTMGNVASWNNGTGTDLADGNKAVGNLVTNNGASTLGYIATFADGSGKIIQDSGLSTANIPTMALNATGPNQMILSGGVSKQLVTTPYTVPATSGATGQILTVTGLNTTAWANPDGGDVVGPSTATNNALVRFDSTTGKLIQNSLAVLDDMGALSGIASINGKTAVDIVTMATPAITPGQVILSAGAGKAAVSAAYTFPTTAGTSGQVLKLAANGLDASWQTIGGGDVSGPANSNVNELAVFSDSTGKLIKNVPLVYLNIVTNPASSTTPNHVAVFDSSTGKSISDSGILISNFVIGPPGTTPGNLASYNGATGKLIENSNIAAANVVQNTGSSTSNAIARFDTATGKLIKNSLIVIDDSGNLTGVGTINGNTAGNFVTMTATPTAANYVYLSSGADKTAKTSSYTFPPGPCAQNFILKTDASGNFQCVADTSGVASFNTRTGAVVPVAGDYTGTMVVNTPSGSISATSTQGAINELEAEKLALAGGTMTGPLITSTQNAILVGAPGANTGELRFLEANAGPNYVGFKSAGILGGNIIWTLPIADGASGTVLSTDGGQNLSWKTISGGDVSGPGSSTSGNLASFSGVGGKTIQDSGVSSANVVTGPGSATSTGVALFNGTTGKIIQSSVVSIDGSGNMAGVGSIASSGNLTLNGSLNVAGTGNFAGALTAQSYANNSDRNLKKDIYPFSGGGDLIDKLMPVTFRWKKGNVRPVIGLIAQDLEMVAPDVVTKNGSIRSYDLGQVLVLTIEALKETRAEVKKLRERIKKLEQKNSP